MIAWELLQLAYLLTCLQFHHTIASYNSIVKYPREEKVVQAFYTTRSSYSGTSSKSPSRSMNHLTFKDGKWRVSKSEGETHSHFWERERERERVEVNHLWVLKLALVATGPIFHLSPTLQGSYFTFTHSYFHFISTPLHCVSFSSHRTFLHLHWITGCYYNSVQCPCNQRTLE